MTTPGQRELQDAIWNGVIPLEIRLSPAECRVYDQADSYYVRQSWGRDRYWGEKIRIADNVAKNRSNILVCRTCLSCSRAYMPSSRLP